MRCKYCTPPRKPIIKFERALGDIGSIMVELFFKADTQSHNDILYLGYNTDIEGVDGAIAWNPVKYCPMCGRKVIVDEGE